MHRYEYFIDGIPPSNNKFIGRNAMWEYREEKQSWEQIIHICCRPRPQQPFERSVVEITYYFKDKRRRDADNYSGKFILDGLRKAGIIVDDSFFNVELRLKAFFGCKRAQTRIVVEEQTEEHEKVK